MMSTGSDVAFAETGMENSATAVESPPGAAYAKTSALKADEDWVSVSGQDVPIGLLDTLRFALKRYGLLGTAGRYLLMKSECRRFERAGCTASERRERKRLLSAFDRIQRNVACAHSPHQFVIMARFILDLEPEGPIVECGCFRGGSTAKLSLLAERTGRRLYVCDSFSGLPEAKDPADGLLMNLDEGPSYCLRPGAYAATLDEVRHNVRRFGCIEVCEFVPGLFHETLPDLGVSPACVFTDVDYVSSARDCLRYLWPRLVPGGCWFTHEAMFHNYVSGIMDPKWWHDTLQECPPLMIGAGSGLSELARSLAYFQKEDRRSTSDLQWPS